MLPARWKGWQRRMRTGSSKGESDGLKIRRGWFDSNPVHHIQGRALTISPRHGEPECYLWPEAVKAR